MGKKTSKHFRAATVNADRHNRREKELGHVRPKLQPEDKSKWMWEAPDKKSVYQMRKQAKHEYAAKEIIVKGKHGQYATHKSMPKNAEPVKEAVVVIKQDTTLDEIKSWADWCYEKYGIRPVGIYIHLDEGHWGELQEGQTEDMYRREDDKEWKRLNERGNFEYWKPNHHAHVLFDWFDHQNGRCINLGRQVMRDMEDELAIRLNMERGTPSKKKHLDPDQFRAVSERKRIVTELNAEIAKQENKMRANDATIREGEQHLNDLDREVKKAETRLKGLNTMLDNLEKHRLDVLADIELLENEVVNNEVEKDELDAKLRKLKTELQLTEDKIVQRKKQLRTALDELQKVGSRRAKIEYEYDEMRRQINRELPTLHDKVIRDMESIAWNFLKEDVRDTAKKIDKFREELPFVVRSELDEALDNSLYETVAKRAEEVVAVAGALFLGYLDQATQYAESAGGGGGPDSGWGREKDEDDLSFGKRCFLLAANMLQPRQGEEENMTQERVRTYRRRW